MPETRTYESLYEDSDYQEENLEDEEDQQRENDDDEEADAAGEELHDIAEVGETADIFADDIAAGDAALVGNVIVVAFRDVSAHADIAVDLDDAVGVQCVLILDNGMEGDDVADFKRVGIAFLDDDHVAVVEGR